MFPGHTVEQCDADQAYVQAELKGIETWVALPQEAWPADWWNADGTPKYKNPVVRMLLSLYGHPDSGTYWELHLDGKLVDGGFVPVESWP